MSKIIVQPEMTCEHCGCRFFYDQGRHCWTCDAMTCPDCVQGGPEPLCPECLEVRLPQHIQPMLARFGKLPADSDAWAFEFKWDGIRAIAYWDTKTMRIESRNLINITAKYPEFADLGQHFNAPVILDGEIVALDENSKPSFTLLQQRMHAPQREVIRRSGRIRAYYFIFDILYWNGQVLMNRPFRQRRKILEDRDLQHPYCRATPLHLGEGRVILNVARKHGLEGVVCKRQNSIYQPGVRSTDWLKIKFVKSVDLVIGGFRYERDNREHIGSLLLGGYDEHLRLRFVCNAGTGFSQADHRLLLQELLPLRQEKNPFDDDLPVKDAVFVKPQLVAEIDYRRWPKGGVIQQASYKGLRMDKTAGEIHLET